MCVQALLGLARQLSESKPRGMCKADIDRLASFQFTSAAANHLSDNDEAVKQSSGAAGEGAVAQTSCVVCMSEFINRQRIRELPCQHIFHVKCIDKWLKVLHTHSLTHLSTYWLARYCVRTLMMVMVVIVVMMMIVVVVVVVVMMIMVVVVMVMFFVVISCNTE